MLLRRRSRRWLTKTRRRLDQASLRSEEIVHIRVTGRDDDERTQRSILTRRACEEYGYMYAGLVAREGNAVVLRFTLRTDVMG